MHVLPTSLACGSNRLVERRANHAATAATAPDGHALLLCSCCTAGAAPWPERFCSPLPRPPMQLNIADESNLSVNVLSLPCRSASKAWTAVYGSCRPPATRRRPCIGHLQTGLPHAGLTSTGSGS